MGEGTRKEGIYILGGIQIEYFGVVSCKKAACTYLLNIVCS